MFFHKPVYKKRMLVFEWMAKLVIPQKAAYHAYFAQNSIQVIRLPFKVIAFTFVFMA